MSESIASADFYNISPSRQERALVHIGDRMNQDDREMAHGIAMSFENIERPMANTAVLIPVAAHQDAGHIFTTMSEYAKQKNCDPFTIFLYLNAPLDDSDMAKVDASRNEVERASEAFPHLDIRTASTFYDRPTIGEIRRDLWNGALMLANHEGTFAAGNDDVIGINNDIDTLAISPHYISRIQKYYKTRQRRANMVGASQAPLKPVGTRVTHGVLPSHPNVGKVTRWVDNTYFQGPEHASYEAGIVIPFSHYALEGGFDRRSRTHETSWVSKDMPMGNLTGAQLYTSPRRYVDRLLEHGTSGIWLPGSFGEYDACRDTLAPDISHEQAEDLVLERMQEDMQIFWLRGAMAHVYDRIEKASSFELGSSSFESTMQEQARQAVDGQLAKADRFLRKIVKSDILADILRDSIDGDEYANDQTQSVILLNRAFDSVTIENGKLQFKIS